MARHEREPGEKEDYQQLTFDAMEDLAPPEITLDRCLIVAQPTYTKKSKGYLWDCVVQALPDLFNQEQDGIYHLHAATYAKEANKKHVQPGDIVLLKGVPFTQELQLQGGDTQVINHLTVSEMTVLTRAPRQTITIFDPKNGI